MKPDKKAEYDDSYLPDSYLSDPTDLDKRITSAMECTGLIPSAILNEEESETYGALYNIHRSAPERQLFHRDETSNND